MEAEQLAIQWNFCQGRNKKGIKDFLEFNENEPPMPHTVEEVLRGYL